MGSGVFLCTVSTVPYAVFMSMCLLSVFDTDMTIGPHCTMTLVHARRRSIIRNRTIGIAILCRARGPVCCDSSEFSRHEEPT